MRVTLRIDSADTNDVRALSAALARAGQRETLSVGCNGPERWAAHTPALSEREARGVLRAALALLGENDDETRAER